MALPAPLGPWGWAGDGLITPPWGPWGPMGASWWHHCSTMKRPRAAMGPNGPPRAPPRAGPGAKIRKNSAPMGTQGLPSGPNPPPAPPTASRAFPQCCAVAGLLTRRGGGFLFCVRFSKNCAVFNRSEILDVFRTFRPHRDLSIL